MALDGDIPQALELLDKAEKDDPDELPVYIDRGNILMASIGTRKPARRFRKPGRSIPRISRRAKGLMTACPGPQ